MNFRLAFLTCAIAIACVLVVGCGGGGNDDGGPADVPAASDASDNENGESSSGGGSGAVSVAAIPGETVVEVDGKSLTYEASGSIYYTCDVGSDRVQVNYQTGEGHDLLIQAAMQSGQWVGNVTFTPGGDSNDRYQAAVGDGDLQVGDGTLTYSGGAQYMEGFDFDTARDVDLTLAVNCAAAGGGEDATAEIDGQTYFFPASGAQSYDCTVADDQFLVMINRLGLEGLQLSLEANQQAGNWIGNVSVIVGDDNYISTLPVDGEGLQIDGSTITYTGTFHHKSTTDRSLAEEVEGSATVTCP